MNRDWATHLSKLLAATALLGVVGLLVGKVAWVMLMGVGLYLIWTLRQARRLHQWLTHEQKPSQPPESYGLWGDLFDGIHRLQKRHEESQDRLKSLLNRVQESTNALNDAVILTNAEGAMDWWNDAANSLLGFKRQVDQGQIIYNLLRDPAFKRYFVNKAYQEPIELASPANLQIQLRIHITLFGHDERLIIAEDISQLTHLERMRKDFVSNVSHEMRTPLTVISGYLETLGDHLDTLPAKWHRPIRTMRHQADRMEQLLADLLLLAKLENTRTRKRDQINLLQPLLEEIRADAMEMDAYREQAICLTGNATTGLLADAPQLRSALSNLVFNAVKYTPAEGDIEIHWWSNAQGVHIAVRDTGIGIDPVHIPRLTERFYRVDGGRHSETGGSGLGLAIVKHVLLNHQGSLEIRSQPGLGSEFICHFPAHRHPPESS